METTNKTFYLRSGKTFTTLKGLAKELKKMGSDVYEHHVAEHKNDFANWVKHSLKKEALAKRIDGQISKIELELQVLRHLVHEDVKLTKKSTPKKTANKPKTTIKKTSLKK